jgi:hypothetical protein
VQARPALFASPTTWIGGVEIALYPVLLALFMPWLFVLARCVVGRRSGPLILLGLWTTFTLGLMMLVPWLVQVGTAAEGLPIRGQGLFSGLAQMSTLLVLAVWLVGLWITLLIWRWPVRRAPGWPTIVLTGTLTGIVVWLMGASLASFAASQLGLVASAGLPIARTVASPFALILALPCSLLASIASVAVGANLAQVLRRSPR